MSHRTYLGAEGSPAELTRWGAGRGRAPREIVFLAVDVDVEADYGAVDDESAGAERSTGGEAGGKTVGDLLLGGGEVGLAEVEAFRDGGVRPRLEVDVPHGAVVELGRWFGHFLQDVER